MIGVTSNLPTLIMTLMPLSISTKAYPLGYKIKIVPLTVVDSMDYRTELLNPTIAKAHPIISS